MQVRRITHGFAALLLGAALAACAATDYGQPVLAFGSATHEGGRLVDAYGQERADANFALRRAVMAQRGDQVVVRGADCRVGARPEDCVLRMGTARTQVGVGASTGRPAELAGALSHYADSLSAVAAATTEADFDTSMTGLSSALAGLAGAVAPAAGGARPADSGTAIAQGLGGLGLQERRFLLLRRAINAADPAVQQAATELAAVVAGQHEAAADDRAALIARLAALYNAMEPQGGVQGAAAAANRDALLARIAELTSTQRRLLSDDPAAELRKLGEAHATLRQGVNDPTPPIARITEELKQLSDRLRRAADAAMRLPLG